MKARYPTADTETSILLRTRQPCADDEQEIIAGRLQLARTKLVEAMRNLKSAGSKLAGAEKTGAAAGLDKKP